VAGPRKGKLTAARRLYDIPVRSAYIFIVYSISAVKVELL
jgi:hypothetical protein